MEAQLRYRIGETALDCHDIDTAINCFHEVLDIVTGYGDRIAEAYALYGEGRAHTAAGDPSRAAHTLRHAGKVAAESGDPMVRAHIELARAEADYAAGALDGVARLAGTVLETFSRLGDRVSQARALRLIGDAMADRTTATAAWREGLKLVAEVATSDARELTDELARRLNRAGRPHPFGVAS